MHFWGGGSSLLYISIAYYMQTGGREGVQIPCKIGYIVNRRLVLCECITYSSYLKLNGQFEWECDFSFNCHLNKSYMGFTVHSPTKKLARCNKVMTCFGVVNIRVHINVSTKC